MTRSQFLGLLTLPFFTRFIKKDEPKFPIIKKGESIFVSSDVMPFKNMAIFIPEGRLGHFTKIDNKSRQTVYLNHWRVTELGVDESIEISQ